MSQHKGKFKSCEVDTILSKLKFVGMLEPGQKIGVNTQTIQDNTYVTSLVRYMSGENREKVFKFVSDLLKDSFSVLNSYANSSDKYDIKICTNMIIDLINLKPGLENLKVTYRKDPSYVARVSTMIENLQVEIEKLCNAHNLNYEEIKKEADERRVSFTGEPPVLPTDEQSSDDEAEADPEPEVDSDKDDVDVPETESSPEPEQQPAAKTVEIGSAMSNDKTTRKKKKKHTHQYDSYYVTKDTDIHLYHPDLKKGLIQ